ncbi:MAG: 16S rRNA (guanine(527)-N(7))-methyltransferase RsmG [Clostridia bacterium]|nr:16S rRNA (guanine(527)-N(7))-methyltransferase RsmG [Clostridia bacterium]
MPLEKKYLDLIQGAFSYSFENEVLERFSSLFDCVVATNEKINITSLLSPIDVSLKHIVDSLALFCDDEFLSHIDRAQMICDIGCGGGFPGLPVASVRKDKKIAMIDSTEKKIVALKENAKILNLENVDPIWGRGEELAGKDGKHREKYDLCLSRAVARLPVLCELCLPFVKTGGIFYALKGAQALQEVDESSKAIPMLGGKLVEVKKIDFDLSFALKMDFSEEEKEKIEQFARAERYLVKIEKKKATNVIYPRKWAQMTKKSL